MNYLASVVAKLQRVAAHKYFRMFIFALFALQTLFLVGAMHIGTPPDESNHIAFIKYYADHSLSPFLAHQTPTWTLGDKTREVDYVYHYVGSLISRVLPGESFDVYTLRVISVVMAIMTFLVLIRILKHLKVGDGAINVGLLMLTNLPMILMLSAAVNNDVAVWLITVTGIWLTLRIWQRPQLLDVLWLLSLSAVGGLIKRTLFPIMLIIALLAVVLVVRKWQVFRKSLSTIDWKLIVAGCFLVVSVGLFIERVGGNIVRYHAITPKCEQVQGKQACSIFWQSSRRRWIDAGAPAASNIWLPQGAAIDHPPISLPVFVAEWAGVTAFNVIDIQTQGWQHTVMPPVWLVSIIFILLVCVISYGIFYDLKHYKRDPLSAKRLFVLAVGLVTVFAQLAVNYSSYKATPIFGLGLNGRYVLPALILFVGLGCFYGAKLFGRKVGTLLAVIVVLMIILGTGLLMMVRNPQLFTG